MQNLDYDKKEEKETLDKICENFENTFLDPCFQRKGGWHRGSGWKKKDFSDYIKNLVAGKVYNHVMIADVESCLRHAHDVDDQLSIEYFQPLYDQGLKYVSIDGNNSSDGIYHFRENEFKVHFENASRAKLFKDLTEKEQKAFLYETKLRVIYLRRILRGQSSVLFKALNKSTNLNNQEKRNCDMSEIADFIREEASKPQNKKAFDAVFREAPQFDKRQHEELLAAMVLYEDSMATENLRSAQLDEWYAKERFSKKNTVSRCRQILKDLELIFSNFTPTRTIKKGRYSNLWRLCGLFLDKGYKIVDHHKFVETFFEYDAKWLEASGDVTEDDQESLSYKHWSTFYNAVKHHKKMEVLLTLFFDENLDRLEEDEIIKKTRNSNDTFSAEDKLKMWKLQNGKDRHGNKISILDVYSDKIEADHVQSFKDGGETTLENGELMTKEENRKKGSKSYAPHFDHQREHFAE